MAAEVKGQEQQDVEMSESGKGIEPLGQVSDRFRVRGSNSWSCNLLRWLDLNMMDNNL